MKKFKVTILILCCVLWANIALGEQQTLKKTLRQQSPIDVSDINDANYSTYLEYLKEHGKSPAEYVLEKFKDHDVVILGEMHEVKENLEFISNLIKPLYHEAGVKCLAMETLKSKNITLINKLVTAKEYDQQLALRLFRDVNWPFWGFKEYMDVLKSIWTLNQSLPSQAKRFKIIGLHYDWDVYDRFFNTEKSKPTISRDDHMETILAQEILEKGEKSLVLIGYNHSFTHYKQPKVKDGKLVGEWPRFAYLLYEKYGNRLFQICLHQRHFSPEAMMGGQPTSKPKLVGFLEKILKLNGNQSLGFDIKNSPFANLRDKFSYYFAFQEKVVFADIAQGYIFLKPLVKLHHKMTWVDGFIGQSNFEKAKAVVVKRGWIKPEECNTPEELDKKMKQIIGAP